MPDVVNRSALEAELAKRFSKLSARHRKELLKLLGNPPNYGNVPNSFWKKVISQLNGSFIPVLTEIYMQQAGTLLQGLPIGVDWGLINEGAIAWAKQHGGELIKGVTDTTQKIVRDAVTAFFEQPMTRADLEKMISPAFGTMRAEMIAITEVTNAASEAEVAIGEELAGEGILMEAFWETRHDDLVCTICGPLHGMKASGYTGKRRPYWIHPDGTKIGPPAAHPRCRCGIDWELPK